MPQIRCSRRKRKFISTSQKEHLAHTRSHIGYGIFGEPSISDTSSENGSDDVKNGLKLPSSRPDIRLPLKKVRDGSVFELAAALTLVTTRNLKKNKSVRFSDMLRENEASSGEDLQMSDPPAPVSPRRSQRVAQSQSTRTLSTDSTRRAYTRVHVGSV